MAIVDGDAEDGLESLLVAFLEVLRDGWPLAIYPPLRYRRHHSYRKRTLHSALDAEMHLPGRDQVTLLLTPISVSRRTVCAAQFPHIDRVLRPLLRR